MEAIADYTKLRENTYYTDNYFGSVWKVTEWTEKGAILRNLLPNRKIGMLISLEPDIFRLDFYPKKTSFGEEDQNECI